MQKIVLASASPRRREILDLAGIPFEVCPAKEEYAPKGLSPADTAVALAKSKCEAVSRQFPDRVVVGADTIVVLDDRILGKPHSEREAVEMLMSLQGRTHTVITGVWVCSPSKSGGFADESRVTFHPMTEEEALEYVRTGEPNDKAGAYAIQGLGMRFVKELSGDFYSVMGLPGGRLRRYLASFPEF